MRQAVEDGSGGRSGDVRRRPYDGVALERGDDLVVGGVTVDEPEAADGIGRARGYCRAGSPAP